MWSLFLPAISHYNVYITLHFYVTIYTGGSLREFSGGIRFSLSRSNATHLKINLSLGEWRNVISYTCFL
jgi:hypothetical protein